MRSPTPADLGLDAAFPALFLALLVPQVRSRQALAAAVLGGDDRARAPPLHARRRPDRRRERRLPDRLEEAVSDIWIVIVVVGALTIALKAVGPVVLGGKAAARST